MGTNPFLNNIPPSSCKEMGIKRASQTRNKLEESESNLKEAIAKIIQDCIFNEN